MSKISKKNVCLSLSAAAAAVLSVCALAQSAAPTVPANGAPGQVTTFPPIHTAQHRYPEVHTQQAKASRTSAPATSKLSKSIGASTAKKTFSRQHTFVINGMNVEFCQHCTYPVIGNKPPITKKASSFGIRPVLSMMGAAGFINVDQSTTNHFGDQKTNSLAGQGAATQPLVSAFVGIEWPFLKHAKVPLAWQTGVAFYQALSAFTVSGMSRMPISPNGDPYGFVFTVEPSQALFYDNKFLATVGKIYHPYATAGLGLTRNSTSGFDMYPISGQNPDPYYYAGQTTYDLGYEVGGGLDVDITALPGLRMGIGYRFIDFGTAKLGPGINTNNENSGTDPGNINQVVQANEIVLQSTYLF